MIDPRQDDEPDHAEAPDPTTDNLLDPDAHAMPRPVYNRAGGTGGKLPD